MCCLSELNKVCDVPRVVIDACSRIVKNTEAVSHVVKISLNAIEAAALHAGQPVLASLTSVLKDAGKVISFRGWIGTVNDIITGKSFWDMPLDPEGKCPDFIRIAQKVCHASSQIAGSINWLIEVGLINSQAITDAACAFAQNMGLKVFLDNVAATVGNLPVFGCIGNMSLAQFQVRASVASVLLDSIEVARDASINGVSIDTWLLTASNAAKLATTALAGSSGYMMVGLGIISATTVASISLIRFIRSEYKL